MHIERKKDLSIYYWLKDIFSPYPAVTVNDGYPDGDLQIPSITVEGEEIRPVEYQMGSRDRIAYRLWTVDVIANNKDMRDEFAYLILDEMENGISVYDYDEGFPPSVSPTEIGLLRTTDIVMQPVRIFPELVEKMYWRISIRFMSEYNPF